MENPGFSPGSNSVDRRATEIEGYCVSTTAAASSAVATSASVSAVSTDCNSPGQSPEPVLEQSFRAEGPAYRRRVPLLLRPGFGPTGRGVLARAGRMGRPGAGGTGPCGVPARAGRMDRMPVGLPGSGTQHSSPAWSGKDHDNTPAAWEAFTRMTGLFHRSAFFS